MLVSIYERNLIKAMDKLIYEARISPSMRNQISLLSKNNTFSHIQNDIQNDIKNDIQILNSMQDSLLKNLSYLRSEMSNLFKWVIETMRLRICSTLEMCQSTIRGYLFKIYMKYMKKNHKLNLLQKKLEIDQFLR
mmetsp:Transcript_21601/g.19164  ORF Transcript_21601/g.19164 Transcript_21601/m.19164 type:complete len:135 (+) Transcript_21601:513-917(+)